MTVTSTPRLVFSESCRHVFADNPSRHGVDRNVEFVRGEVDTVGRSVATADPAAGRGVIQTLLLLCNSTAFNPLSEIRLGLLDMRFQKCGLKAGFKPVRLNYMYIISGSPISIQTYTKRRLDDSAPHG